MHLYSVAVARSEQKCRATCLLRHAVNFRGWQEDVSGDGTGAQCLGYEGVWYTVVYATDGNEQAGKGRGEDGEQSEGIAAQGPSQDTPGVYGKGIRAGGKM